MIDKERNKVFIVPLDLIKVLKFLNDQREYWKSYNDELRKDATDMIFTPDGYKSDYHFSWSKEQEYEWLLEKFKNEWHKFV
jgi:hypothetical protein